MSLDPITGKPRGRGRPPKNPFNQYTGVRGRNIDYVRQALRRLIEENKVEGKSALLACRMLLVCEGLNPYGLYTSGRAKELYKDAQKKVLNMSEDAAETGEVKMPDLLAEIGDGADD